MRRRFPNRRIRSRASAVEEAFARRASVLGGRLAVAALLALAALAGLAFALAWRQYDQGKEQALRDVRARAILAATIFDTYFDGRLATLAAVAETPTFRSVDVAAMNAYLERLDPEKRKLFTGGIGWLDRQGIQRATSGAAGPSDLNLADRSYFRQVVATGAPFVSEAIVTRVSDRRMIVMASPTRGADGRLNGVLAAGLLLTPSRTDQRAIDLGYAGLQVIDRTGQQLTLRSLPRPANEALAQRLRAEKEGVLADVPGLDGAEGHVVAFATSPTPGWVTVIDQPASTVYAAARRAFLLESLLIGAATLTVLGLILWATRRSRRELRAERNQVRRWARLTRTLHEAADEATIASVLAASLAAEVPRATVAVTLIGDEPRQPMAATARGGQAPVVSQAELADLARAPDEVETGPGEPPRPGRAAHRVPLLDEARSPVGWVALLVRREDALDEHALAIVQAHADQAGQALARVRRQVHEHDTSVLLQRSLLPAALPTPEGMALDAHYQAGGAHDEVGGDWYDVVRRPDGIVHLTVGDVAGRGIASAVLMGQLRNAFRAYALDHASPAAIVERLSRHVDDDRMATTVCVAVDPFTRELTYSSAGHLPPLLVGAAGETRRLDGTAGPPLGWSSRGAQIDAHETLAPGTLLALYTDGLVERRGHGLDEGIDGLAAELVGFVRGAPGRTAGEVVERLGRADADDDVALLLVGIGEVPAAIGLEIPAQPALLRELRRRIDRWLTLRGVDEERRQNVVLALSEACNNAIEHGYRNGHGTVSLRLEHDRERLRIVIDDEGTWVDPTMDDTRGRGLLIMRALMNDADVEHGANGTRVTLEQRLG